MATWRLLFSTNQVNLLCTRRLATQDSIVSKLRRNVEKDILPPKPKRPLNPFIQYCLSIKNTLQKEYPNYTYSDIVKKASKQWAQVEPKVKENLRKQYMEQHLIYKQKLQDYENSITWDQKALVNEQLIKKEHEWEKNQVKQKLAELGKPKRPLSAFFLFLQNKQDSKDPQVLYKDWVNNVSKEWKNMTKEAKEKYVAEATQLRDKYKIDLKKWEKNMIQAGHQNLLKSNTKSKRVTNIDMHKKQDLECPNQSSIQTVELIAENSSNIKTQNKENVKIGWGTDIPQYTLQSGPADNACLDEQYESTKSLLCDEDKNLQAKVKYSKEAAKDLKDVSTSIVQPHDTQKHKYFVFMWKKFLTVLKKTVKNWKTVREYVFIGTAAILISIFCVLNLMYK